MTLVKLEEVTAKWSQERGILANGKATTQMLKLVSEFGELGKNMNKQGGDFRDDIGDCMVVLTNLSYLGKTKEGFNLSHNPVDTNGNFNYFYLGEQLGLMSDAIIKNQDITELITNSVNALARIAYLAGYTLEGCWTLAYNEIKDRKGFLNEHGNFIKSTDENYEQMYMEFTKKQEEELRTKEAAAQIEDKPEDKPAVDKVKEKVTKK